MKHATIPVFVPHAACRNNCVFCNQRRIAGTVRPPDDIEAFLESAALGLSDRFDEVDIAFFGGSFTGIELSEQRRYLSAAKKVRERHSQITGIRLSTRPDYISEAILTMLKSYGVTAVELGAQSFDDTVLKLAGRGHSAQAIYDASRLIRAYGFELVLQLMPGLPGDDGTAFEKTVTEAISLHPDGVRIYPCVVVKETALEDMFLRGEFTPLTVEKAVEISAKAVLLFRENNIKILRVGLHSSDLVKDGSVVSGPFHPAFGELVSQYIYLQNEETLFAEAEKSGLSETEIILVGRGKTSCATGRKRSNILYLEKRFGVHIAVEEAEIMGEFEVERKTL